MDYQKVIELVKEAGKIVFDKELKNSVSMKGDADFVTAVDFKISNFLKEKLATLAPETGFMSEEEESEILPERWILDPIDGTTNLVYNYNASSVSLAHCKNGKILFGVVYNPFNGDTFTAERGKGAFLNGERLSTVVDRELKDCIIEFGAGSTKKQYADTVFDIAKTVFKECLDLRRICSSALAICYVAAGRLNGYFEQTLKPWDYAAATLLLEECGAECSDWNGNAVRYDKPSSFICGSPKAMRFLYETVKKYS